MDIIHRRPLDTSSESSTDEIQSSPSSSSSSSSDDQSMSNNRSDTTDENRRRRMSQILRASSSSSSSSSSSTSSTAGSGGRSNSSSRNRDKKNNEAFEAFLRHREWENVEMEGVATGELLHELVLGHLIECGYKNSAASFLQTLEAEKKRLGQSSSFQMEENGANVEKQRALMFQNIDERKKMCDCITQGRITEAVELAQEHFNDVLSKRLEVEFGLNSLVFIEMVRQGQRREALSFAQKCLSSLVKRAKMGEISSSMDIDTDNESDSDLNKSKKQQKTATTTVEGDRSEKFMNELKDMLALLCYQQPEKSPVAYLLSRDYCDAIARMINSAILTEQNLPPDAPLKKNLQQLTTCLQDQFHDDLHVKGVKWRFMNELS